jgi:hypothetical protein
VYELEFTMSMRVHKAIGYGMRGFKATSRFLENREVLCEGGWQALHDWAMAHASAIQDLHRDVFPDGAIAYFDLGFPTHKPDEGLSRYVMYDDEFGYKDALLLRPLICSGDWHRYDDSIDYLEERRGGVPKTQRRWKSLKTALYPYSFGHPPISITTLCMYLGIPEVLPHLQESLYVWWS